MSREGGCSSSSTCNYSSCHNRCGHQHPTTTAIAACDKAKIDVVITPNDYLALSREQKQNNEQLALTALLSIYDDQDHEQHRCAVSRTEQGEVPDDDDDNDNNEQESNILAHLVQDISICCPRLFTKKAVVQELLRHGCDSVVMPMLTRQDICWDRELVLAALTRCDCFYPRLPMDLQRDHDIALGAMRRGTDPSEVPFDLLCDKEFVLQAMDVNPNIFSECGVELGSDTDVLVKVYSVADCELLSQLDDILHYKFEIETKDALVPLSKHVREKLDAHETFQTFLKCMSVSASRGQGILPLQLLQCGEETKTAWKRQIAALLGAPCNRSEIQGLNKVWERVSLYCFCRSKNCCTTQILRKRSDEAVMQIVNEKWSSN